MLNHTQNNVLSEQIKNNLSKIKLLEKKIENSKGIINQADNMKPRLEKKLIELKSENKILRESLSKRFESAVSK